MYVIFNRILFHVFMFRNPVNLTSVLKIGDSATEKLRTKFKFQTQSTDYIPVKSHQADSSLFLISLSPGHK